MTNVQTVGYVAVEGSCLITCLIFIWMGYKAVGWPALLAIVPVIGMALVVFGDWLP